MTLFAKSMIKLRRKPIFFFFFFFDIMKNSLKAEFVKPTVCRRVFIVKNDGSEKFYSI